MLEGAEIVAITDLNPEAATKFAESNGAEVVESFEALIARKDIDIIDICLPTYLHAEYAIKALNAGHHVFCEKPMARTVAECDAMIAAEKSSGKRLMIGHCIRFWAEYALVKKLRQSQELGKLLSINLTRYGEFPSWGSNNWLANEEKAGGGAFDMHIHDTDFALYLFGEPKEVLSRGTVDDRGVSQIFTTMTFAGGEIAHLEGGWNLPPKTPFKMAFRAIFESGAAIWDGGPMTIYPANGQPYQPEFPKMSAAGGGNISDLGGYFLEIQEFISCISSGKPFTVSTSESSRESVRLALSEISQVKEHQS